MILKKYFIYCYKVIPQIAKVLTKYVVHKLEILQKVIES